MVICDEWYYSHYPLGTIYIYFLKIETHLKKNVYKYIIDIIDMNIYDAWLADENVGWKMKQLRTKCWDIVLAYFTFI